MSIDWEKTVQDLNKTQKVKAQFLIDLKKKIEILEINLEQKNNDLKLISEKFIDSERLIQEFKEHQTVLEKGNRNLITKNEELNKKLIEKDGSISELRRIEKELINRTKELSGENEKLKIESQQIKKQFETEIANLTSLYESKINELEINFGQMEENSDTLKNKFKLYNDNLLSLKSENTKLKEDNLRLNSQISEKELVISKLTEELRENKNLVNSQKVYIEEIEEKKEKTLSEGDIQLNSFEKYGEYRIMCPLCDAKGSEIREIEDRDNILGYINHKPIFAKKKVCKKCGYKFS